MRDFIEETWPILLPAVVLLAVLCVVGYITTSVHAECLKLGYPGSQVTPWLDTYCIVRVDQTDVVVTVDEARRHPRTQ